MEVFSPLEVAREYFPNYTDEQLSDIIWNHTGYPDFWLIGEDGATPEECFRTQLKEFLEK